MKVLVIGSGGREHALVWKIAQSPLVEEISIASGNAGTEKEICSSGMPVKNLPIDAEDIDGLMNYANSMKPDLSVVGPDNPLAKGIVDRFQYDHHRIWGPNKKAAKFESSKIFSQAFMARHGIPTARSGSFDECISARSFVRELGGKCVVKADGLALGKGVIVCENASEADRAIRRILEDRIFGDAGNRILIQERLYGKEVSLHAFCDGSTYRLFPISQDYKRAKDHDEGLNTGGMGAFSWANEVSENMLSEARSCIFDPWMKGCKEEEIDYRGIIYPGLILTKEGLKVLEFNARFGDPEAQVYLRLLKTDLIEIINATLDGSLKGLEIEWSDDACICIVIASEGYPESYEKGRFISGIEEAERLPTIKVFHAGTQKKNGAMITSGGRVLGITSMSKRSENSQRSYNSQTSNNSESLKELNDLDELESLKRSKGSDDFAELESLKHLKKLEEARLRAYEATSRIHFDGAFFRSDIGFSKDHIK